MNMTLQKTATPCLKIRQLSPTLSWNNDKVYLPQEEPLQISINSIPYSLTMRTPGADKELITGLLFTEKVYQKEIHLWDQFDFDEQGLATHINAQVNANNLLKSIADNRSLISTSSCGFCGKKDLKDIELQNEMIEDSIALPADRIALLFEKMTKGQALFSKTGATHAAALFDSALNLISLYEDIGRHNALDKAIGYLQMNKQLTSAKILLVSGRISYEIVVKAMRAHIPIILAISAPTSLAVEIAKEKGITLGGFCRGEQATIYCHHQRIILGGQPCQKTLAF